MPDKFERHPVYECAMSNRYATSHKRLVPCVTKVVLAEVVWPKPPTYHSDELRNRPSSNTKCPRAPAGEWTPTGPYTSNGEQRRAVAAYGKPASPATRASKKGMFPCVTALSSGVELRPLKALAACGPAWRQRRVASLSPIRLCA